jgi:hypothetical protein
MSWPPDELRSRIAALWHHVHGAPGANAGERANAFTALKQLQADFELSDCQLAYIAEYQTLDPSSRIVERPRRENAFEITLAVIDDVKLVMPFEHLVIDTAWILHTYVFTQFLHTPRLLIHSRGSGFGKTVRLSILRELASQCRCWVAPSAAVIYHFLETCPLSTLVIDDAERMDWGRKSLLVQVIDAGHRQGFFIPRFDPVRKKIVEYPTFAPLALGLLLDRYFREMFLSQVTQVLTRSIVCEMQKSNAGLDQIKPGDPRFVPVRVVIARWAETFRRPEIPVSLPQGLFARCATNYQALAEVADSLGYGATLRAAAVAIEAANFDPEIQLYQDIFLAFERPQVDRFWINELVQALKEINDRWAALTNSALYEQLWKRGIEYRTVWKTSASGERRSNKGFMRSQFEPVWRELLGHGETHSNKIIRLPRHKRGTE